MKRKIISINEEKCNGCGACIPDCPEGALQVIDGKARIVSDLFCDGLGACVKACPQDAMQVIEREAESYDEYKVMENIVQQGENTIKAHLIHLKDHGETLLLNQALSFLKERNLKVPNIEEKKLACGCSATLEQDLRIQEKMDDKKVNLRNYLNNWPVQLKLINVEAGYFKNANLVIAADCSPFAYANFHQDFLKDKILINFCPKLDLSNDSYIEKLAVIFKKHNIQSISLVYMEVPCCGGLKVIIEKALEKAGKKILIQDYKISIRGEILNLAQKL